MKSNTNIMDYFNISYYIANAGCIKWLVRSCAGYVWNEKVTKAESRFSKI